MKKQDLETRAWYRLVKLLFILSALLTIVLTILQFRPETPVSNPTTVKYSNGEVVVFNGTPSQQDIQEVAIKNEIPYENDARVIDNVPETVVYNWEYVLECFFVEFLIFAATRYAFLYVIGGKEFVRIKWPSELLRN